MEFNYFSHSSLLSDCTSVTRMQTAFYDFIIIFLSFIAGLNLTEIIIKVWIIIILINCLYVVKLTWDLWEKLWQRHDATPTSNADSWFAVTGGMTTYYHSSMHKTLETVIRLNRIRSCIPLAHHPTCINGICMRNWFQITRLKWLRFFSWINCMRRWVIAIESFTSMDHDYKVSVQWTVMEQMSLWQYFFHQFYQ